MFMSRSVVAFENPMYDDPHSTGSTGPVYGELDDASEGMYAEPASNVKANVRLCHD